MLSATGKECAYLILRVMAGPLSLDYRMSSAYIVYNLYRETDCKD